MKGVSEMSPVKRRSPRKKPVGRLNSEDCPSPQKSPRGLTGRGGCIELVVFNNALCFFMSHTFSCVCVSFLSVLSTFFYLGSAAKSPRKSPYKHTVVTSSFYGKKKPIYLTPLERKAIKESLPSPPPSLPSPPSQEKKKNKKNVKGSSKPRKVAAKSKTAGKMAIQSYATASKAIKLPKLNNRFVSISVRPMIDASVFLFLDMWILIINYL